VGSIVAIEAVRDRFFKLRAVLALQGAANVRSYCMDGRRFQARDGLFDKVLVDAPCSAEGRFNRFTPKSFGYWSSRKIKEMAKKQKGLLLNASRCVRSGGILVYATCTFAPEENEAVIDWFLRKSNGSFQLESFDMPGVPRYPVPEII
jgi:16S rRNA C967 or C1407 C5-methylase (RsmB/RsmF family)